ncbi:MAG: hypothetical protein CVU08_15130 [Bacteroidetes bacterium HGW-Bacteroidetes-3]|jgi:hypothetical protein|nr:MAG: hypothetical protein CVU08_15130 [Bacteroidetes bacterium HGW-Bacteroidetes-3]
MKFTTVHLGNNKIELFNSILGKETIKVNQKIVSEKYSVFGTVHSFNILENEREVECKLTTGFSLNGVVFDFYQDGKPIIESPKSSLFGIVIMLIFGIIIYNVIAKM